jgi:hypothetical protein
MMVNTKQVMKPSCDFCDECKYLRGDEDGENYYQYCEMAKMANIESLRECPVDDGMGIEIN